MTARFLVPEGVRLMPAKSVEWQGLTLSRRPNEIEAGMVKAIADAQDRGAGEAAAVLLALKAGMIDEAERLLLAMSPANYHTLILSIPDSERAKLNEVLTRVYREGRRQVRRELGVQGTTQAAPDVSLLTTIAVSTVALDVAARAAGAALLLAAAGVTGEAMRRSLRGRLDDLSDAPYRQTGAGAANIALGMGRDDEAAEHEWSRVQYSALLDRNVCEVCRAEDGKTADDPKKLKPAPNPGCKGGWKCRCFHVWVKD